VAELADAHASRACDRKVIWVRFPSSVLLMGSPLKTITWNSHLAYIVGLLVTDGNLSKDGRHIIFRSSDYDLLETFKCCLSLHNKISLSKNNGYAKKPSYRLQFGDVQLYKWLLAIGLTPNKSLTISEIQVPNEYFRDFLRGHLDGDGTILTYIDNYNIYKEHKYTYIRLYLKFISASEKHIKWLYSKIIYLKNVRGSVTKFINHGSTIWTIKFAKKRLTSSIKMDLL
jgi:hypothetical protein